LKTFATLAAFGALVACSNGAPVSDEVAQAGAKKVITPIISAQIPGANTEVITNCIIESATASEIFALFGATVTGATEKTTELVLEIAARPEAVSCIANASLTTLLAGTT
jgi:hypothetical protein